MLARANPAHAEQLMALAQRDADERWRFYEQMAGIARDVAGRAELGGGPPAGVTS
jgi:pyruvate-ferredoxin/flavodoxin oxidoreductase